MKIIVTKIFYRSPDAAGYQWCIEMENDGGQTMPMPRCDTRQLAADWIDRFNAKSKTGPLAVEWRESGHFSLAMAQEYIEGTDPAAEAERDAMMGRVKKYLDREGL